MVATTATTSAATTAPRSNGFTCLVSSHCSLRLEPASGAARDNRPDATARGRFHAVLARLLRHARPRRGAVPHRRRDARARVRAPRPPPRDLVERRRRRHRARRRVTQPRALHHLAARPPAEHARRSRRAPRRVRRDPRQAAKRAAPHACSSPTRRPPRCSRSSGAAGCRSRCARTGTGTSSPRWPRPGSADCVDLLVSSAWAGRAEAASQDLPLDARAARRRRATAAVFVGDTWGPDVEGPRALGITPVYLERDGHWPDTDRHPAPDGDRRRVR